MTTPSFAAPVMKRRGAWLRSTPETCLPVSCADARRSERRAPSAATLVGICIISMLALGVRWRHQRYAAETALGLKLREDRNGDDFPKDLRLHQPAVHGATSTAMASLRNDATASSTAPAPVAQVSLEPSSHESALEGSSAPPHCTPAADANAQCAAWARDGQCSSNPDYMHHHCGTSCAWCGPDDASPMAGAPIAAPAESALQRPRYFKDAADHADRHAGCARWARLGECVRNRGYMAAQCYASCADELGKDVWEATG